METCRSRFVTLVALVCLLLVAGAGFAADDLEKGFHNPPDSAWPWVYWFWSDGNLTREGITADLEAMRKVGIRGVLIMEVDQGIPPGPARFMSPKWRELFKFVLAEADRLGIEVNMNNDGGWCGSGGPWVKPEHAMQMVVWSETRVEGPRRFEGVLPQPKATAGFYRDIGVLAVPSPPTNDPSMAACKAKLTAADGKELDASKLLDGDAATSVPIPNPQPGKPCSLRLEFPKPVVARALGVKLATWNMGCDGELLASSDGREFKPVRAFSARWPASTFNFPEVSARFFRLDFKAFNPPWAAGLSVGEIALHGSPRMEEIVGKAGYVRQDTFSDASVTNVPRELAVSHAKVVDLGAKMDPSGRIAWDVPAGTWTLLRFGYTPTGAKNAPAPAESIGLECDKLSKEAIEAHFGGFIGKLLEDQKALGSRSLKMTHIDSWEIGSQNWTPRMREEFQKRRGYDPLPWLAVLSGQPIESPELSDRFLWDLRKTIGDLLHENYAGHMQEICRRNGIKLSIEAYGDCVFDSLSYAGRADIPMSEFWVGGGALEVGKAMSSAAHTYGKTIIGAEAFTASADVGKWMNHPYSLKSLGDAAFCEGINRFIFHRYAMQPWLNRVPGMTMGPWGVHYERTETWWNQTQPWHEYLARSQFLLQQGRFVADLCYLQTEASPNGLFHAPRSTYDYDGCTPEVVLTRMSVRDGRLVLPDGMSYRVLVLPQSDTMTPVLLRKIAELVEAGATVVGPPPKRSPSLADYPNCDAEVKQLGDRLWADCNGKKVTEHRVGKGRVIWGKTPEAVLAEMNVPPDLRCETEALRGGLRYIHRSVGETDVYFLANISQKPLERLCTFRVKGKRAEFWRQETGTIEPIATFDEIDDGTRVPIWLDVAGSVFVVFRPEKARVADPAVALLRDGEPVLRVAGPKTRMEIRKATYGVPGDAARTRDVTAQVQRLVDRGQYEFAVSSMADEGDPAVQVVKTLVVEYVVAGKQRMAKGTDADKIALVSSPHDIVVKKATYGVPGDPTRTRDVTANVQRMIDRGEQAFQVAVLAQSGDPAFLVVKTLTVEYAIDGKPETVSGKDFDMILFSSASEPRQAGVRCGDDGRLIVETSRPGRYEVRTASGKTHSLDVPALPQPLAVTGPWELQFPAGWGAPEQVTLDKLISWSEHANPGVKYFSGTAIYRKTVHVPESLLGKNRRIDLDLGRVQVIAEVKFNGKDLGILWQPPFRVDVTGLVKPGENSLEVRVTNLWVNRLIGDEQLPEDCQRNPDGNLKEWPRWLLEGKPNPTGRHTFAAWRHWTKDSPLLESGLLGPVRIQATAEVPVESR